MQVQYQPARTVDAEKIYLSNARLRGLWTKEMITLEEGMEMYYRYLVGLEKNHV